MKPQSCTGNDIQIEIIQQKKLLKILNSICVKMENFLMENILIEVVIANNNNSAIVLAHFHVNPHSIRAVAAETNIGQLEVYIE